MCCRGARAVPADEIQRPEDAAQSPQPPSTPSHDFAAVREDIAGRLRDRQHDDGSLAPLMIRYAWHHCGTYDRHKRTGGSNGGTMRFDVERADPENAGFAKAHALVKAVKDRFPALSSADIAILAGYVALEQTGGPAVPFAAGRRDLDIDEARKVHGPSGCPFGDGKHNPNGSRLPAADLGPREGCPVSASMAEREAPTIEAMRGTFERLGFDDKETVALIVLGHQYGRCHLDVSGFEGPWYAFDPAHWNCYESGLGYPSTYAFGVARDGYRPRQTDKGKRQWEMHFGGGEPFMMLVSDMCLYWDEAYRRHLLHYDRHRREFRRDAALAWKKLTELGCEGLLVAEVRT